MSYQIDKSKIAKNTIALYVRMAITMVISFFTTRVMLEQLGVDDFGLNNLVASIVLMFSFLNGSMGTAVQRFYSIEIGKGNEDNLKRIFGTALYLHICVAIISVIIAEIFAVFFLHMMNIPTERMFAAQVVFQFSVVSLALNIISVPYSALLRARELFSKTAKMDVAEAVLRLGVLYLLYNINYDKLITLSCLNFGVTIIYVGGLTYLALKFKETHSRPLVDKVIKKKMFSFISFLIVTIFCQLGNTQGLIMLVNIFFGIAINAAYAVAIQVSNLINTFAMNFKSSMVPQLMAAYGAKDIPAMEKIINTGTKITFLLMMMVSIPLLFDNEIILRLWLKNPPAHTSLLVMLVVINVNIASFTYFHYQSIHAIGDIKGQQICYSTLYMLSILLIYLCFKMGLNFGFAIYVNMVISVAQCAVNLYFAKKKFSYDVLKFIIKILMPCLVLAVLVGVILFVSTGIFNASIGRLFIDTLVGEIIVFVFGFFVLLDKQEQLKVKGLVFAKFIK